MKILRNILVAGAILGLLPYGALADDDLGNISFPNSGDAAAQEAFLTGVKALHSFQFDEARFAFEEAQEIDPDFALAYWGQAMSDNHPLWAQQDEAAATAALKRLAPTFEGRLAKAPTEKEKAYLEAVEVLYYSADDKLERDQNYAAHMAKMQERWPDDHEIAIFRSLSLLGTVRRGDRGFKRQAEAAAIALEVFDENPNHPGAAHFIIHSFDDPQHAILALPAAEVYAGIAPAAAHALHMPSHIFLQLGHWEGVVNSNIDAFAAAVATNEKYGLAEGREDFHTLSWLSYANLMLGHYEKSAANVQTALDTVERNPGVEHVLNGYLNMKARYAIETGDRQAGSLPAADTAEGQHANWVAAIGMSAARRGDSDVASAAESRLDELKATADSAGDAYSARMIEILALEVKAVRLLEEGDNEAAIEAAAKAADNERQYMRMPSGPPMPIKPAGELYAEVLLDADKPAEAMAAFRQSLDWIPRRTPSMVGLGKAAARNGDQETAQQVYANLRDMPGANPEGRYFKAAASAVASGGK